MRAASNLHAKIIVVDRTFALVGSANLTNPGTGAGDRNKAELGVIFTTPADVDHVAVVFSSWWNELGPSEQFTDRDLEGLPSTRPARRAFDPIRGRDLSVPVPVTALQRRRKSAINALLDGLVSTNRELPKSDLVHFPDQDTEAYRSVNRLRHRVRGDRSENQETRTVLLEVLSRHRDPAARAHAAYRLATDDWLHHGAKTEIQATLAERVKTDPARLVQKRSQFALDQLD